MNRSLSNGGFADTKPHYALLDGLRGVAALLVLWHHVFEGYAFAGGKAVIEGCNHGYLAVDFFFILSGFVIAYAYDDRWGSTLDLRDFFRRRLIRLQPMVVMGALIGLVCFLLQGGAAWDGSKADRLSVIGAAVLTLLFIPVTGTRFDVRGNGEMFPLNGPQWSLFFEYLGNIIYALFIRRLSTMALGALVAVLGLALAAFTLFDFSSMGCLSVGWTLDTFNFVGGFLRMMFPFTMGLYMARRFKPTPVRGAFWICSVVLVLLFHVPYIGADVGAICLNGLFEVLCIAVVFPIIVYVAASGRTTDAGSSRVCSFLGDISYPLYIVHYTIFYLFYAWLIEEQRYTFASTWPVALGVCLFSVLLSWLLLKFYDEPVRRWLSRK